MANTEILKRKIKNQRKRLGQLEASITALRENQSSERERLINLIIDIVDKADFMWSSPRNFKDRIIIDIRNADLD